MSSEGTPLHGDRSAWNVMSFDTEHGKDIMDSTLRRHLPLPGAAGGVAQSDGTDWQRVNSLPLTDIASYARGFIIRGGASDWEPYDASTDGAALVGDGTDIISTLAPTWKGGHTFNDGITLSANSTSAGTLDINHECLLAGGNTALEAFVFQTDGTGMTGTLRGAYLTASGGNTANTGTIRGAEIKARAGRPGETGNDVAVLEAISASADAKTYTVTTLRGAELILDGASGAAVTLAVGLRIANNFQADVATTSYGLQIYRDSFDYTADIQLSHGHTIADGASAITFNAALIATGLTLNGLGAGAVQSSAAGVISSGALPLTDLAGYTQGDLIYGGAADWQDLAHPGAANRVLQSTAAEVGWSANAVTFPAAGAVPVGTGGANQVAYWTGVNALAGDAGMTYNAGTDTLAVGAIDVASGGDVDPVDASGQDLGDATHRWDLYTQEVHFDGATGSNFVNLTDNLANAFHILDDGAGDIYLQIVTTTGSEAVIFNAGEDDVDFRVAVAGGIHDPTYALAVNGATGAVSMGIAPSSDSHLYLSDASMVITTNYFALHSRHTVTDASGATEADDVFGIYSSVTMNDAGQTIGFLYGADVRAILTAGNIGDDVEDLVGAIFTAQQTGGVVADNVIGCHMYANLDAGTIGNDVMAMCIRADIEAAVTSIGGDVFGLYIFMDIDKAPTGSVYHIFLDERDGVDYGIYQSGTAPHYFGGDLIVSDGWIVGIGAGLERLVFDAAGDISVMGADFGVGTLAADRLTHAEVSDAVTNVVTYAQRLSHTTSGAAAALFGTGTEHELEDAGGAMQVASEMVTLWASAAAGVESPLYRLSTYPQGTVGPGYVGFWTWDDVDNNARTVIPNGAGDVVRGIRMMYTIYVNAAAAFSAAEVTLTPGAAAHDMYNVAGEQFTLTCAADGSVSVVRAAGADTADIALLMLWIN